MAFKKRKPPKLSEAATNNFKRKEDIKYKDRLDKIKMIKSTK